MKTNTIKFILILLTAAGLPLIATTRAIASNPSVVSICISYVALAILFAVAVLDYRSGPRSYLAR